MKICGFILFYFFIFFFFWGGGGGGGGHYEIRLFLRGFISIHFRAF